MSAEFRLALVFCLVCLACTGRSGEAPLDLGGTPAARFDGERAFSDLRALVEIGERSAGSPGAAKTRALIRERLGQAGWLAEPHRFSARAEGQGVLTLENVLAKRPGRSERIILVGAHYDTKRIDGIRFVGANDGASGVAVLLELARVLGPGPGEFPIWLVCFDGEEAFGGNISDWDGLYGSRALAAQMARDGSLERVGAFVLLDMVGDRDLDLVNDTGSSPRLRRFLREEAERMGVGEIVERGSRLHVVDDHVPFRERGVEDVLLLMDFQFGGRRVPGPYWHTERDDLAAVSAESLNTVGRLTVLILERIESFLAMDSTPGE